VAEAVVAAETVAVATAVIEPAVRAS
jgi:hypothetical protein